jgi:thymidylate synthase
VKLQLTREPYKLPRMIVNPDITDILKFRFDDFTLMDYVSHPHIKGDISV